VTRILLPWEWVALGYYTYLLLVASTVRRFARARMAALAGAVACGLALGVQDQSWLGAGTNQWMFAVIVPSLALLFGYWLSGRFFVAPMREVEAWLMAVDTRWLRTPGILATYADGPRVVREILETAYVLVYAIIPAGVATLAIGGHAHAIPRFWTVVLLAEFLSYGMMPWLQTRPPRVLESAVGMIPPGSMVRRLNGAILDRGSIQANTVPSGHAAGAVATALAVMGVMPYAGAVFLALALAIVVATVVGRYHYLIDSLLGVLVAAGVWYFFG